MSPGKSCVVRQELTVGCGMSRWSGQGYIVVLKRKAAREENPATEETWQANTSGKATTFPAEASETLVVFVVVKFLERKSGVGGWYSNCN